MADLLWPGDERAGEVFTDAALLHGLVAVEQAWLDVLVDRGIAPPTLGRVLAAIGHAHRTAGLVPPHKADGGAVVLDILAGIRRSRGRPAVRKAAADS